MRKSVANDNRSGRGIRAFLLLVVCCAAGNAAALEDGHWPTATYYTVLAHPGDTVSTIADRYRAPPSLIARLNGLNTTTRIFAGTIVLIPAATLATRNAVLYEATDRSAPNYATRPTPTGIARSAVGSPVRELKPRPPRHAANTILAADAGRQTLLRFSWPIAGPVISSFGPGAYGTRNEGINIAAERGAPFRAAAGGTVSYAGPLSGYGNLILITHSHSFITAYAHADNVTVARGDAVERGQVIGTAGITGGVDRPQLHFEVRRGVTPLDPNLLLAANS